MRTTITRTIGAAVLTAGLLVPTTAQAGSLSAAVEKVAQHTERADAALERAVAHFEKNADTRGSSALAHSRSEIDKATAAAARLRRSAHSRSERAAAARAAALVGAQQDENVDALVGALDEVGGEVENAVARAALRDTTGREKAIAVISAILGAGVPAEQAAGLSVAITALSTSRDEEIEDEAKALASSKVGTVAKRRLAAAVDASVEGQSTAATKLKSLIEDPDMPAEAKPALHRAYTEIEAEHGSVADILSRFSDRMPASIRDFVEKVVTQARTDARSMGDSRPAPPTGQPSGTPTGQPSGTPTGQPSGTPTGQPSGTSTSQPGDTPASQPSDTPTGQPGGTTYP